MQNSSQIKQSLPPVHYEAWSGGSVGAAIASRAGVDNLTRSLSNVFAPVMQAQTDAFTKLAHQMVPNHVTHQHSSANEMPASLPGGVSKLPYGSDISAAYTVLASGVNHGITLQGALSSALTGNAIGGPVGAAVGLGINLLGGIFGHHSDPLAVSKAQDPALYNSPSQMDYAAYRYRESANLSLPAGTTAGQNGLAWWQMQGAHAPQSAPVVHLYLDGVQQTVQSNVQNATSASEASRANAYYDMHRPI